MKAEALKWDVNRDVVELAKVVSRYGQHGIMNAVKIEEKK